MSSLVFFLSSNSFPLHLLAQAMYTMNLSKHKSDQVHWLL